jgi:putative transposase
VVEGARDLIRHICQARKVVIVRGAVSPDRIHPLLSAPPVLSPSKLAQYIEGRSSRHLQAELPDAQVLLGTTDLVRGYFLCDDGSGGRGNDQSLY